VRTEARTRQGLGGALLCLVEKTAIERGRTHALLETFDFQALPFYQKHGYSISSELQGFPPGGSKFALTKPLRRDDQAQPRRNHP
jgi:ribosomal protein S18 acetylase RimI-like enzyme